MFNVMISSGLRSVSVSVCVYTSPAVIDLEGSGSLRSVSKEGQARAKPGAFGRLGFKGSYHFFCQIQQSPALWLASCFVRTLLFLIHSHSLRWDAISFRRHRRTWCTASRAVIEDVRMGTDLFKTKARSLWHIEGDTHHMLGTNGIFSGRRPHKKWPRSSSYKNIFSFFLNMRTQITETDNDFLI